MKPLHLSIDYKGKHIKAKALPLNTYQVQGVSLVQHLFINGKDYGLVC